MAPLTAAGARAAKDPRDAVTDADVVVAMVSDDEASRSVWLGDRGALAGIKPGAIVVELSTLTPKWVKELAASARNHGAELLDAPVGGSKGAAANGQLTFFVGGDAATLERARPALEAVGAKIVHVGPTGAGATWKLINNMLVAVHAAALAEALALADNAGFDRKTVAGLISSGAAYSLIVQMKLPRMTEERFGEPDFALKHMLKDATYARALGDELGVELGLLAAAEAVYRRAAELGLGELDIAAVAQAAKG